MSLARNIAKLAASVNSSGKLPSAGIDVGAALANLGFTPVNKAGDTMTGNLIVPGTNQGFQTNYSGGICMYGNELNSGGQGTNGDLYVGARNTNYIRNRRALINESQNAYGNAIYLGCHDGVRDCFRTEKRNWQANGQNYTVAQVSTDWNDWEPGYVLIEAHTSEYSGGGQYLWYWRLGYGTNTLTNLYATGEGGGAGSLTVSGVNQVSGQPSDCQYVNLIWAGGYYNWLTFNIYTRGISPVSSITGYNQIAFP